MRANRPADLSAQSHAPLDQNSFGVLTLHRPSNVDDPATLTQNLELILELAIELPIIFPVHPRTVGRLKEFGLWERLTSSPRAIVVEPLAYLDLLALTTVARVVLTDSGGIQEECCVVGTPCLTLRANTERPATLAENGGANHLVGTDPQHVKEVFYRVLNQPRKPYRPPLWDGHTAKRVLDRLCG